MKIKLDDIAQAVEFVSADSDGENTAYIDRETGRYFYVSAVVEPEPDRPHDLSDARYVAIPNKQELDLGTWLVYAFADDYMPEYAQQIRQFFRKKGAYRQLSEFLAENDMTDAWHAYRDAAEQRAIRTWCGENGIELAD